MPPKKGKKTKIDEEGLEQFGIFEEEDEGEYDKESWRNVG